MWFNTEAFGMALKVEINDEEMIDGIVIQSLKSSLDSVESHQHMLKGIKNRDGTFLNPGQAEDYKENKKLIKALKRVINYHLPHSEHIK
jgi:hypothetical protein